MNRLKHPRRDWTPYFLPPYPLSSPYSLIIISHRMHTICILKVSVASIGSSASTKDSGGKKSDGDQQPEMPKDPTSLLVDMAYDTNTSVPGWAGTYTLIEDSSTFVSIPSSKPDTLDWTVDTSNILKLWSQSNDATQGRRIAIFEMPQDVKDSLQTSNSYMCALINNPGKFTTYKLGDSVDVLDYGDSDDTHTWIHISDKASRKVTIQDASSE